jgi:hypothetical protein
MSEKLELKPEMRREGVAQRYTRYGFVEYPSPAVPDFYTRYDLLGAEWSEDGQKVLMRYAGHREGDVTIGIPLGGKSWSPPSAMWFPLGAGVVTLFPEGR